MAIQLNERDHLIFKLIDEHQVLLEKHISWFISGDDKPVLIRDRLRKLFYLDYLLCHRHATKLPWWTTPTKPLVYMLAPLSRTISNLKDEEIDLFDADVQRHLLEVANLRMMHLIGVKENEISDFTWTTCKAAEGTTKHVDAIVKFTVGGHTRNFGIVNHPAANAELISNIEKAIKAGVESVLIVSRDEAHQATVQTLLATSSVSKNVFFSTHHELYKNGIVKSAWQGADQRAADVFSSNVVAAFATPTFTAVAI
jgi:hypothetical protein